MENNTKTECRFDDSTLGRIIQYLQLLIRILSVVSGVAPLSSETSKETEKLNHEKVQLNCSPTHSGYFLSKLNLNKYLIWYKNCLDTGDCRLRRS